jgi:hypothetical protein
MNITLSKSKYLVGTQCPKRLWLESHRRDLTPPVSPAQERVFSAGHEVGRLARERFPGGILIEEDPLRWRDAAVATKRALEAGAQILFEPCFFHADTISRADIMVRNTNGSFDVIEVKSNTGTKAVHVLDLAVQTFVYEGSGLRIRKACLMHLNSACRYPDLSDLFTTADLSVEVRAYFPEVPGTIAALKATLAMDEEPRIHLGSRCTNPYDCGFFEYCSKLWKLPSPSVFDIPHLSADKRDELIERGVLALDDIPPDATLGSQGERFLKLYREGRKEIDLAAIRAWLGGLRFPLYFLDFETDAPAIPRLSGLGPFGSIPFQFSLHILNEDGSVVEAEGFLHADSSDPRPAIAHALLEQIGSEGSIIAYNASFEKRVIGQLAELLPELKPALGSMQDRFADLLDVFRKHYIDPAFKGSNSIKAVLPVICPELSYTVLDVRNGEDAQVAWSELISTEDPARKASLSEALKRYCGLDTLAMVRLYQYLITLR